MSFNQQLENLFDTFKPTLKAYIQYVLKDQSDFDIEITPVLYEYNKSIQVVAKRRLGVAYAATFDTFALIKLYQQISNEDCIVHAEFLAELLRVLNTNSKAFHDLMQSGSCNISKVLNLGLKNISGMLINVDSNAYTLFLEFANPELFDKEKMVTAKPSVQFKFGLSHNDKEWKFKSLDLEHCFKQIREKARFF